MRSNALMPTLRSPTLDAAYVVAVKAGAVGQFLLVETTRLARGAHDATRVAERRVLAAGGHGAGPSAGRHQARRQAAIAARILARRPRD